MQTRRDVIRMLTAFPFGVAYIPSGKPRILAEPDCLSNESARGFSLLAHPPRDLIIVCAAGANAARLAPELRKQAHRGAWIVWEQRPGTSPEVTRALRHTFEIRLRAPVKPGLLILYTCPKPTWTRSFLECTPAECPGAVAIAHHEATPVCLKRRIGRGGIVFLGSMLGPNLWAEEPQAHSIAQNLFASL